MPPQFPQYFDNFRIVISVHLHRDLGNRGQEFVRRGEEGIPFCAFDVHFDDHSLADPSVFSELVFQCIEEAGIFGTGSISHALIMKYHGAAVAEWACGIKAIVFMDRHVIPAGHLAAPVIVTANAIGIGRIDRLDQVLAHQVSAIVRAAEAFQGTVFQCHRLKLGQNGFAQPAPSRFAHEIAHDDRAAERESNNDKGEANRGSVQGS